VNGPLDDDDNELLDDDDDEPVDLSDDELDFDGGFDEDDGLELPGA
jgi:hypothetical protein